MTAAAADDAATPEQGRPVKPSAAAGVPGVDRDDLVRIARDWAAECDWPGAPEDVDELPDEVVSTAR